MKNTFRHYGVRTYFIHIDSYEHGAAKGQYYNLCGEESGQFMNLAQLILQMEKSMNRDNVPHSSCQIRTFYPSGDQFINEYLMNDVNGPCLRKGRLGTFAVQIGFRRNASWQGTLIWVEQNIIRNFRSVLELLLLLEEALKQPA